MNIHNPEFQLAEQFALHTDQPIFLTGKAGTGKTTLLKNIAEQTIKNFVVVAPTGVAAINAGGVTIHSMFNLPLTSFIPTNDFVDRNVATNRRMLAGHIRFNKDKRKVIEEMELLIIDEVSMVRCDILDAVDYVLQIIRRNKNPFGGVQVLLIGDMQQLSPVTRENEWELLKQHYPSPYFFDSQVYQKLDAVQIELKKIYRQQDELFLNILNNIRNKELTEQDYGELEKRFFPEFNPKEPGYILLSTHNRKADNVNENELRKLSSMLYSFEAIIEDDFPDHINPCERILNLKLGAQVMFIKNDTEGGMYYNGKLAVISEINENKITVTFNDSGGRFTLHRETWENINYTVEKETERVKKNILGSFTQYPLRLAWAITIHKSQGLTFDKVIIDAGQSFAPGQVYVALSRCRSLEGIVLHSRITQDVLYSDTTIDTFSSRHHHLSRLEPLLAEAKARFSRQQLKRLFTFEKLIYRIAEWKELIESKSIPDKETPLQLNKQIGEEMNQLIETAGRFHIQLEKLLIAYETDVRQVDTLKERCAKAIDYFNQTIFDKAINPLQKHITEYAYKSKVKKYVNDVMDLQNGFWNKINQLYAATFMNEQLYTAERKISRQQIQQAETSNTSKKKEKGSTFKDTLELHKQGKSLEEIAVIRSLSVGTIKSHIAKWVLAGEVNIKDVMPLDRLEKFETFIKKHVVPDYAAFKNEMSEYDYNDLRMVMNHLSRKEKS